jgi:hypothetical protein
MFLGHYGVSFAGKAVDTRLPLWALFVAVQFVDVLWAVFVLLGVEKVKLVPGITATNPLDLYYMPYTHSLVAAGLWSLAASLAYRWWRGPAGARGAGVVAVAVFSHWALDLLVHRPDLPLYDNVHKVGLDLWNYPRLSFLLEAAILVIGVLLYARKASATSPRGRVGVWVLTAALLLGNATFYFGPFLPSPTAVAVLVLVSYIVCTGAAAWVERRRG